MVAQEGEAPARHGLSPTDVCPVDISREPQMETEEERERNHARFGSYLGFFPGFNWPKLQSCQTTHVHLPSAVHTFTPSSMTTRPIYQLKKTHMAV